MPIMLRPEGKPTKVAYKILGEPANLKDDKPAFSQKVIKRLQYENARKQR